MKQLNNKKGFTLIEVVLVLAIGGLIFLLAFIAFQQASKGRRDTQRRSDAATLVGQIQNYKGDKNKIPTAATSGTDSFGEFLTTYMEGSNFKDPTGTSYTIWTTGNLVTPQIKYTPGTSTNNTNSCAGKNLSSSEYKIEIALESGTVCRDSIGSN